MNTWTPSRRHALLSLGSLACLPLASWAAAATLPGDSVYQLRAELVDQDGSAFELSSLRGNPVLASMFYTSCEMVCPMIFETIQRTVKALPAADQRAMKMLMVSIDPARDSVAVLKKTANAHACDARWTLARRDDATVRKLAAVLGIQYRQLPSGEFNHSSTIELLDREGRIAARSGKLGSVDPALVKAIRQSV
jgi:protein SCO1/2